MPWRAISLCLVVGTKLAFSQTIVWQPTSGPFVDAVRALVISSKYIFAGTDGRGVLRTSDDGANWTAVNLGLSNLHVRALAINSQRHIFAGTNGGGVSRSIDSGENWISLNTGLTNAFVRCLAINASDHIFAGTLFGGIFLSTNNGANWTELNTDLVNTAVSALTINASGHVFAGTTSGVLRSMDNGLSWTPVNTGLTFTDVWSFVINPATRNIFAGTNGGGIFRSMDNGSNWTAVNSGLTVNRIYAVAINSLGHLFAGASGGVFRSTNNGGSWTAVNSGLLDTDVRALVINASGRIFAGTLNGWVFRSAQSTTAVKEIAGDLPMAFSLEQNYPNPFNPGTTIRFALPHSGYVTLKVYNTLGEEVATLAAENLPAGKYQAAWNAGEIASGVYFYRLQVVDPAHGGAGAAVQTKRLVLMR